MSEDKHPEYVDLAHYRINTDVAKQLPEQYARAYSALALSEDEDGILVGMVDPNDIDAVDAIGQELGSPVITTRIDEDALDTILDTVYRRSEQISMHAEALEEELHATSQQTRGSGGSEQEQVTDAPVINLLQSLFEDAVQVGASDIHIEPDESFLRLRMRVDGLLQEQIMGEKKIAPAIALRLKLIAGLNIAEKRIPQDGRFNMRVKDKPIDVRLSTLPTEYGETAVMRLLDQSEDNVGLEKTGMDDDLLARFRKLLHRRDGVILVTGPTGSGKSTTLTSALKELNQPETKIISIEDPVEYHIPRVTQAQVSEKLGMTFAAILRSALRQDPDVVMVGEMRDVETSNIAMRAALTGHLVLSTLHTNDSASTAFRLIDMGIKGFLVGTTLRGVLAQGLARRSCSECQQQHTLADHERNWLQAVESPVIDENTVFYEGKGCAYCNHTGYRGRVGVFELLELDKEMIDALREDEPSRFHKQASKVLYGERMVDNALKLAVKGKTSVAEVMRVIGEV